MSLATNQKIYLETISKESSLEGCYTQSYYERGGQIHANARWVSFDDASFPVDYRVPMQNEIVFDLDITPWIECKTQTVQLCSTLESLHIPYNLFLSGGKGTHTHIYPKLPQKPEIIKLKGQAEKLGAEPRDFRYWFWNYVLNEMGITSEERGRGKAYDSSVVFFDELNSKGHLIRCCGGRKWQIKKKRFRYKTSVEVEDLRDRKDDLDKEELIRFPGAAERWMVPEGLALQCLKDVIEMKVKQNKKEYNPIIELEKGHYTKLPCVTKLIEGVKEGQRNEATKIVTFACHLDGLQREGSAHLLKSLAHNSIQKSHAFTSEEAMSWWPFVESRVEPKWIYCAKAQKMGYCDKDSCELWGKRFSEIYGFMDRENLLDIIVEIIQQKVDFKLHQDVVGEEKNLKMLFLIMMSAYSDNPQNLRLQEESGVGKTAITIPFTKYFPEENVLKAAGLSKKAIYYNHATPQDDGSAVVDLTNKIIILLEESGSMDFLKEIKAILSHDDKRITYQYVEDGEGKEVIVTGFPAYIGLSVYSGRSIEQSTREWTLNPIATSDKFSKVNLNRAWKNPYTRGILHPYTRVFKQAIRTGWQRIPIMNLFAHRIHPFFNHDDPRSQRDFDKFMSLIEMITFIHQRQRPVIAIQSIVSDENDEEIRKGWVDGVWTTREDIRHAIDIAGDSLLSTISGVSPKIHMFHKETCRILTDLGMLDEPQGYDAIQGYFKDIFKRSVTQSGLKKSYLAVLEDIGMVSIESKTKPHKVRFHQTFGRGHHDKFEKFKKDVLEIEIEKKDVMYFMELSGFIAADMKLRKWDGAQRIDDGAFNDAALIDIIDDLNKVNLDLMPKINIQEPLPLIQKELDIETDEAVATFTEYEVKKDAGAV